MTSKKLFVSVQPHPGMMTAPSNESVVRIAMHTPHEGPELPTPRLTESLPSQLASIRTVFVFLFLVTVAATSVSLTITGYTAQSHMVDADIQYRIAQLNVIITSNIDEFFVWTTRGLTTNTDIFYDMVVPPNGTFMFTHFPGVSTLLGSMAKQQPTGALLEFCLPDGRIMGLQIFPDSYVPYTIDWDANREETRLISWAANRTTPLWAAGLDVTTPILNISYPWPSYRFLLNTGRDFLINCESPIWWEGISGYFDGTSLIHTIQGAFKTVCNKNKQMIGYQYVSVAIESYNDLLSDLGKDYVGKFLIIDASKQLVASSTATPIFVFDEDADMVRKNVTSTDEEWIKQAYERIVQNKDGTTVHVNGTKYYMSVEHWAKYPGIEWDIVVLLDYDNMMAETTANIRRSIIISVCIAIGAVLIALIVTYVITKPLLMLSRNMQRIAELDLDSDSGTQTPRLIEAKRLYKSYMGMRAALRSFKKFVPVQVVSKIINSNKEVASELQFQQITVMFQDIEGFTTISEAMLPASLAKITSEYLSVMTAIIVKHGGTIDKYIGDCIMSLFNAPEELSDHPRAAVESAVECIRALIEKNREWKAKYGVEMNFRTGIHTGEVLIGNMGSDNRMNYTAFGDNVNIAARLESVNKLFGTRIICSKIVYKTFPPGQFTTRKLAKIRVSGKSVATTVFEVKGDPMPSTKILFAAYDKALHFAKQGELESSLSHIEDALQIEPKDKASLHLKERILEGIRDPDKWSYIEDLVKL